MELSRFYFENNTLKRTMTDNAVGHVEGINRCLEHVRDTDKIWQVNICTIKGVGEDTG